MRHATWWCTKTRSPSWKFLTFFPVLAMIPVGSCPRTSGVRSFRYHSRRSVPQIPQAFISTRISLGWIFGFGISSIRMSSGW